MSEDQIDTPDAPDEDEIELFLTQEARVTVRLGTQFTYRGNSHWPKVEIADGPLVVEGEDGQLHAEEGDFLLYRVSELAHRTLGATIARMKIEIDARYEDDQAARAAAPTATS